MTERPGDGGGEMRALAWDHGVVSVCSLGGMIGPTAFLLPGGRQVSPFHTAPWINSADGAALDGLMSNLRGEWPCVPFGYPLPAPDYPDSWPAALEDSAQTADVHGYGSNAPWSFDGSGEGALSLRIDYPQEHAIARLERRVRPDPEAAALDLSLTIHARRPTCEPVGLHGCFRLPLAVGGARLVPGAFRTGRTHPVTIEPEAPIFAANRTFDDLRTVPDRAGTVRDATRLPFAANGEDVLQLDGIDGRFGLVNGDEGYRVDVAWDADILPSALLWFSNRGRSAAPWNNRHLCIGIEPIASPFGMSPDMARADNPIAASGIRTCVPLDPSTPLTIAYRIAVSGVGQAA